VLPPTAAAGPAAGGGDHADTTSDSPGTNALPVGYNHYHHHVYITPTLATSHATPHTSTPSPTPRSAPFCPDAASFWMGTWPGESPWGYSILNNLMCKCHLDWKIIVLPGNWTAIPSLWCRNESLHIGSLSLIFVCFHCYDRYSCVLFGTVENN
jgi:hypothetical protein